MREIFLKFINKLFCRHKTVTFIEMDHQEGYCKFKCNDCGKEIYSDL